jgi:hypothetical protein
MENRESIEKNQQNQKKRGRERQWVRECNANYF